jgi:hypothetical protein
MILELLADPDGTGRLGRAAREWTAEHADVERYAAGIADVVAMAGAPGG